jgi:hypothetical protein
LLVAALALFALSAAPAAADSPLAWSVADVDGSNALNAVSCASESLCVATDKSGNVVTSTNPTAGASAWSSPANVLSTYAKVRSSERSAG